MNISTASTDTTTGPVAFRTGKAALEAAKKLDGKKREAKKKPAASKPKVAPKKSAPKKKPAKKSEGPTWTKAKVYGMRGERPAVLGVENKSRMVRIDAAYADYLTKEAKRQGLSITALTRKLVK